MQGSDAIQLTPVEPGFIKLRGEPFWHKRTSTICTSRARVTYHCRMLKKARLLTRPTLARRDAPSPKQGRSEARTGGVPSGAHGATNREYPVCARRRVSEAAGSPLRILAS
jgi:hypothetical protein